MKQCAIQQADVYAETIYQRASSGAPAVINTHDPASSRNQLLVATDIRHLLLNDLNRE